MHITLCVISLESLRRWKMASIGYALIAKHQNNWQWMGSIPTLAAEILQMVSYRRTWKWIRSDCEMPPTCNNMAHFLVGWVAIIKNDRGIIILINIKCIHILQYISYTYLKIKEILFYVQLLIDWSSTKITYCFCCWNH